jgi:hypothetical protein
LSCFARSVGCKTNVIVIVVAVSISAAMRVPLAMQTMIQMTETRRQFCWFNIQRRRLELLATI